jgi:hypothetical protein
MAMFAVWFGAAMSARAEHRLAIAMSGTCPARGAVIAALADVLPDLEIVDGDPEAAALVVASDEGPTYRVDIAGVTRWFVDPSGHCEDRARKVAIVAALGLAPPMIEVRAPRASRSAGALAIQLPPSRFALQLETGGVFDTAPGAGGDRIYAGVDVHLALGRPDLAVVVGGAVVAPTMLAMIAGRARVQRVPIDVALRGRIARGGIAAVVEIGPRFTLQTSDGVDVMQSVHAVRLESGARIASRMEIWPSRRCGAYLQLHGEYVPRPSRFTLSDLGEVGQMPSLWVGASLGLAIHMR